MAMTDEIKEIVKTRAARAGALFESSETVSGECSSDVFTAREDIPLSLSLADRLEEMGVDADVVLQCRKNAVRGMVLALDDLFCMDSGKDRGALQFEHDGSRISFHIPQEPVASLQFFADRMDAVDDSGAYMKKLAEFRKMFDEAAEEYESMSPANKGAVEAKLARALGSIRLELGTRDMDGRNSFWVSLNLDPPFYDQTSVVIGSRRGRSGHAALMDAALAEAFPGVEPFSCGSADGPRDA